MTKVSEILSTGLLLIIVFAFVAFIAFLLIEAQALFVAFAVPVTIVFVVGYVASKAIEAYQ